MCQEQDHLNQVHAGKRFASTFTVWLSLWVLAVLTIPVLLVLFLFLEAYSWINKLLRRKEGKPKESGSV